MNHGDVKKYLADYLEGDLGLNRRAVVDAHLDQCEECSREVTEMQQTIRLLRLLPEPETPPMIAANVMRRIRAGESRPGVIQRVLGGFGAIFEPSFVLPASAIAAAALVVMVAQAPGEGGLGKIWSPVSPANVAATEFPGAGQQAATARLARVVGLDSAEASATPLASNSSRTTIRPTGIPAAGAQSDGIATERMPASDSTAVRRRGDVDAMAGSGARASRRTIFSDPILAPPIPNALVPDVYAANRTGRTGFAPPSATFVRDRIGGGRPGALNVSQRLAPRIQGTISSGGEDARDAWLARGLEDPVNFARFIGEKSLAEQELWVARLSERAEARGLLEELVLALRGSRDDTASWLADDFSAQAERMRNAGEIESETAIR